MLSEHLPRSSMAFTHLPEAERSPQELLDELLNIKLSPDDIPMLKSVRMKYYQEHHKVACFKGYVSGILRKLVYFRRHLMGDDAVCHHIEFMTVLGMSQAEILLALFDMGYRGITERAIGKHINETVPKMRINALHRDYMAEIDLLKRTAFQELGAKVMEVEKRHLETLLAKLPILQDKLDKIDPIDEAPEWSKLNKLINGILTQCKAMHGIDLYREATVKTQAAIAIQPAAGKQETSGYALPTAARHPELQEAEIIETRMVIKQEKEEL